MTRQELHPWVEGKVWGTALSREEDRMRQLVAGLTLSSTGLTGPGVSAKGAALGSMRQGQAFLGEAEMVGPLRTSPSQPISLTGSSPVHLSPVPKWVAGCCRQSGKGSGPAQGDLLTALLVAKAHPSSGP